MGNESTKYYCSAVLYNLSLRHVLTREPGFMAGLVDLTSNHASARQLLCSKIFANGTRHRETRRDRKGFQRCRYAMVKRVKSFVAGLRNSGPA